MVHRLKIIAAALVLLLIVICSVWIFFATDPESGISTYKIYRNGTNIGTATTTTYSNTGLTSDFQARCNAPGVIRCVGFDSSAEIFGGWGDATGIIDNGAAPIQLDKSVKASGNSSLKFTIPPNSNANTSGQYFANFSDDLSIQFGEGDEFYIQWRQRFSPEFLDTIYKGGGGWKQTIIGEGDRPGQPVGSCTQLEIVTHNTYHRGFLQMYHSCGRKDGKYQPLLVSVPPYDYLLQNAIPGCLYSLGQTGTYVPPCIGYKPDQWMTFQVRIKIGTWYKNDGNYHKDSTIQLWVAEEDKPSQLIIDFSPETRHGYDIANNNPEAKYGKIWLLPYNTGKSSAQNYPIAHTWYDELIISRTKIPDPTSSGEDQKPSTVRSDLKSKPDRESQIDSAWTAAADPREVKIQRFGPLEVVLAIHQRPEWRNFKILVWQYKTSVFSDIKLYRQAGLGGFHIDRGAGKEKAVEFSIQGHFPYYVDHAADKGFLHLTGENVRAVRNKYDVFYGNIYTVESILRLLS